MSFPAFRAVRDYSPQSGSAKLVLTYIADAIYDRNGGIATMRYRELEASANITERYLRSILRRLIEAGELIVCPREGRQNAYAIPLYPEELGYEPPAPCEATDHVCNRCHANWQVDRDAIEKAEGKARGQRVKTRVTSETTNPSARNARPEQQPRPAEQRPGEHLASQRQRERPTPAAGPARPAQPGQPDALPLPVADLLPVVDCIPDCGGDFDLSAYPIPDPARDRHALVPPAKRRRNPGAGGGMGGWPA